MKQQDPNLPSQNPWNHYRPVRKKFRTLNFEWHYWHWPRTIDHNPRRNTAPLGNQIHSVGAALANSEPSSFNVKFTSEPAKGSSPKIKRKSSSQSHTLGVLPWNISNHSFQNQTPSNPQISWRTGQLLSNDYLIYSAPTHPRTTIKIPSSPYPSLMMGRR